jgi:acyl-CoA synthetase (AMP-forming)/AMP-acid ligase II
LMKDGSIKEVLVWGETDPTCGQRICAAFVPNADGTLTPSDVMGICRKGLEPFKWPDEVMIVESLPRNASGKVMRARPPVSAAT